MRTISWALLLSSAACGGALETPSEAITSAATAAPAEVHFYGNWTATAVGAMEIGQPLRLHYDASRLAQCRGDINGHPGWSITAHWSFNGGPAHAGTIAGYAPDGGRIADGTLALDLEEAGDLAFWFEITSVYGCQAWDSDYGRNFHFTVGRAPEATLHFARDWTETLEGALGAGSAVLVDYDLARLPNCRQGYNGLATWDVLAEYRFDGGRVTQVPVTRIDGMGRLPAAARIEVPRDARRLEVWFKNTDRGGCVAWDSDYGRNYSWPVR